ncbi:MAG: T9SS type A sorting domain-containing protein [Bacteroidetes bacterium]|nr:T9SS type A sorting domain-containing protein [Bacteroidota bacterium]
MYPHLEIRLGRTRDAGYLPSGGPNTFLETVPVFKADSIVLANTHRPGRWIKFPINQAPYYFDYDTTQNLVVELRSGPGSATDYWGISGCEVRDTGHVVYLQGWISNPIAQGPLAFSDLAGFGFDITPLGVGAEPSKTWGKLVAYPNPVQDVLRVSGALPAAAYQILDLSGRSVQSGTISLNLQVSTSGLAPGSYLLQVGDGPGRQTTRFIKQ